jgi:hypothetical protein
LSRDEVLSQIEEYQFGLARLGALDEADQIGTLAHSLRLSVHFDERVLRKLETRFGLPEAR